VSIRSLALTMLLTTGLAGLHAHGADAASYPANVRAALDSAGANRGELEKVLQHFEQKGDTLMLRAAYFLIGNMPGHSYVTYDLVDTTGTVVPFTVTDYPNFDSLLKSFDSMEAAHGTLDFRSQVKSEDVKTIKAFYLIENIEHAFRAWRTRPWAKNLDFGDFLEGVLPYRGSNEPLEVWRPQLMARYDYLPSKMVDSTDPVEAAALINEDIKTWFGFDERWYFHPTDQGLAEMQQGGLGRCEDMTNVTIYAMRANGIGVTSDYTPYWADHGNNHAWNAIILPGGKAIPFMGAEADPGKYHLTWKAAKIYRKTYADQPGNLAFAKAPDEKVPRWLGGKSYTDVSAAYGDVSDVTIAFDEPVDDSIHFAYLCVFNDGEWKAIQWGRIRNNRVVFPAMLRGVALLPMYFIDEELVPAGDPFILTEQGAVEPLVGHLERPAELVITSTTRRTQEKSTESFEISYLTPGKEYELFYWDDGWQSLGEAEATDEPIEFLAPSGALYWLVAVDSKREEERIFTYSDGRQVWW